VLKRLLKTAVFASSAILTCASSTVLPRAVSAAEIAPTHDASSHEPALDLKAPDIHRIFSPAQIDAVLREATDPALEHIEVEALRLGDLPLKDNSASAAETVARTVAWLFLPHAVFGATEHAPTDATDPYLPPPYVPALHHHAGATRE
jgi:hypothetical protein